ncbi:MAG: DUF559 domain-containing protein [Acidobacteria bacterium]|nr:DUF559 domain-containing protein [Acidobacteriota bacterium]
MSGKFSSPLKNQARKLRKEDTIAEKIAWTQLRDRRTLNLKFRRQVAIDRFIVDFYCDELKLVIELDGVVHGEPGHPERDEERDKRLAELGYKVVRIPNEALLDEASDVLLETIRSLLPSPGSPAASHPLPEGECYSARPNRPA